MEVKNAQAMTEFRCDDGYGDMATPTKFGFPKLINT